MTASSSEALFPWVCTASYSVFSWEPRLEVDGPAKDMLANSGLQSSSYCICSSGMSIWKRSVSSVSHYTGILWSAGHVMVYLFIPSSF